MHCKITIGIPTVGRAAVLRDTLRELEWQTRPADSIIVCGTKPSDVEGAAEVAAKVKVMLHAPGLPHQRNAVIAAAIETDILVFFDDDFLPESGYLASVERHMIADPRVVMATGRVLADGVNGPGLTAEEGKAILHRAPMLSPMPSDDIRPVFSGYGCNMAIRLAALRENGLAFDERLPLYGWQEDVDLSRRLAPFGTVVRIDAARGVHLGVKSGRGSGVRLGYSQVANPLYLAQKRDGYPFTRALHHLGRNMAMNIVRSIRPEAYVDRRGRLRGNLLAVRDLLAGRMAPERVLEL